MIFSIFGRKNGGKKAPEAKPKSGTDSLLTSTTGNGASQNTDPASSMLAQRQIARATERKIDAIEYEMSRDIIKSRPGPSPETIPQELDSADKLFDDDDEKNAVIAPPPNQADHFETTIPLIGAITQYLLGPNTTAGVIPNNAQLENIPALEEAAILFASEQTDAAELILQNLIQNNSYNALSPTAWLMLFDLYQITDNRDKFELLSLEYVNKLEISAPIWITPQAQQKTKVENTFIPGLSFSGKLNTDISRQIDKLVALAKQHPQIRLEFVRITEIDIEGCEHLLRGFQSLKKTKNELTVVGAHDLINDVRSLVAVGRRDESQAPWLLMLELLQLLNNEAGFEEASIDYCITYEVSPPPFEAPKTKSSAPSVGISIEFVEPDQFLLPSIIEGNTDGLVADIAAFAKKHNSVQLDCSQLNRIDFTACGQLLSGLIPLSEQINVSIEFHDANQLVIALLNAMGFKNIAVIYPRKH